MPIKIPNGLPAAKILNGENVFIMQQSRADSQDIRPLRILIVNLMPKKIDTETQLLRLLGNTPLQVEVELLGMASHSSKTTPREHLLKFYKTFEEIRRQRFDGMILTGAPIELIDFEEVDYWKELCELLDWARENVFCSYFICWGAQAALYRYYGVPKHMLKEKLFGVFKHNICNENHYLFYGFDDVFYAPHSRHTEVRAEDIAKIPELEILSVSKEAGVYAVAARDRRQFFITGHSEYDRDTLGQEYRRDLAAGKPIHMPEGYFPGDNAEARPLFRWKAHAHMLYGNWLNYFVYQMTPYNFISGGK
ncbi:MAG: homoserine O-succinyltransferase [Oscillospiraceae bacterium]|jgi:homoserine O-succinyltransferase|nr:homoserine O-succinyltransferase [Oscillospiraceae bacterium]